MTEIPFFIFSTPRSRGELLVRMLDATNGSRCMGEAFDFLARVRKLNEFRDTLLRDHAEDFGTAEERQDVHCRWLNHSTREGWNAAAQQMIRGMVNPRAGDSQWGMRDIHTLRDGKWPNALDFWSWLLETLPDARMIFLSRDNAALEISLEVTHKLWVPRFGDCPGGVLKRIRQIRQNMADFHAMNPSRCVCLDADEVLDFDVLAAKLAGIGLRVDEEAWAQEKAVITGDARSIAVSSASPVKPGEYLPPPPIAERSVPVESIRAYTLRFGAPEWMEWCVPSQDAWAQRHGLSLSVWSEWNPSYPCAKFAVVDMIEEFLAGAGEWFLFLDADIVVHPQAPMIDFSAPGLHARVDQWGRVPFKWRDWLKEHALTVDPREVKRWKYLNAGLWACDRETAARILEQVRSGPMIEGIQEQHQLNLWWLLAAGEGAAVNFLSSRQVAHSLFEVVPSWMHHLAGPKKRQYLDAAINAGFLPSPAPKFDVPEELPTLPFAVVYPYRHEAATWEELRYSLRSVQEHLWDKQCPILIYGTAKPHWLQETERIRFIPCANYADALRHGLLAAEKVLWMNDDIYLLKPITPGDLTPLHMEPLIPRVPALMKCNNTWKRGLARAALDVQHHSGAAPLNFSTHTPYLFDRERVLEVFKRFPMEHKTPFETLYFNLHQDLPRRKIGFERTSILPESRAIFLNHTDSTLHEAIKVSLQRCFPDPAAWEESPVVLAGLSSRG